MEFIFLFLEAFMIIMTVIICLRELCLNYFNSSPKFDNKIEKSINKIEFIKFRSVQKFSRD